MIARILLTLAMLLLAAGGFFGAAPGPAGPLDPFGILFLFVSGVTWLAWDSVREAFADRVDMIIVRLGPMVRHNDPRSGGPMPISVTGLPDRRRKNRSTPSGH